MLNERAGLRQPMHTLTAQASYSSSPELRLQQIANATRQLLRTRRAAITCCHELRIFQFTPDGAFHNPKGVVLTLRLTWSAQPKGVVLRSDHVDMYNPGGCDVVM